MRAVSPQLIATKERVLYLLCNLKDVNRLIQSFAFMALQLPQIQFDRFGSVQDRLEYLIEMIGQLDSMSAADLPTVSRHLKAAREEAVRLSALRDRR